MRLLCALGFFITTTLMLLVLTSCSGKTGFIGLHGSSHQSGESGADSNDKSDSSDGNGSDEENTPADEIQIPESDNFSKNAVKFDEIAFSLPDMQWLYATLDKAESVVSENVLSFDEQLAHITVAQNAYDNFITMYTYLEIIKHRDISENSFTEEREMLEGYYPSVMKEMEEMLVAAANSPHAVRFESEYYGRDLINKYRDNGKYTDNVMALLEDEERLVKQFIELSPTTVYVYFDGVTDTYTHTIERLKNRYGEDTPEYAIAEKKCAKAYEVRLKETTSDLLVSLLKVRKRIADQLRYDSYTEYAYATLYRDYPPEYTELLTKNIADYMVPVYDKSYIRVLKDYVTPTPHGLGTATILNTLGVALKSTDNDLYDAYSFMLSYGLFDIGAFADGRYGKDVTMYLTSFDSPYLYVNSDGSVIDYATVTHEFGHFYDMFVNWGDNASTNLSEISSRALEMLMLTSLKEHLSADDYKFLYHSEMNHLMSDIISYAFYSRFEHLAYELSYYDITRENLEKCAKQAAREMGLDPDNYGNISAVASYEVFCQPLNSQAYCISSTVALDIFFKEMMIKGDGFAVYKALVDRKNAGNFGDMLTRASLESPFSDDMIKRISDLCHYYIFGSHYYEEYKNSTLQHKTVGAIYFTSDEIFKKRAA